MLNLKIPSGVSKLLNALNSQNIVGFNKSTRDEGWALTTEDGGVIDIDTILNIDVDSTNKVMQAPTEVGGFAMYNKAIDDLFEDANEMAIEVDTGTYTLKAIGIGLLEQIAEQLKAGGDNESK